VAKTHGILFRVLRLLALALLLVLVVGAGLLWYGGAWNIVFPSSAHDTLPPALPASLGSPAILVFSKTNGFRHRDGIAGGTVALESIAGARGWQLYATENGAVFNSGMLDRFNAVVFLNATGDMLSTAQQGAFEQWLQAGGGWLGIHAAGDDSHAGWKWYVDQLIGSRFIGHILGPQYQRATVVLENQRHPVVQGVPDIWDHEEEWYSWAKSPRAAGFTVLATIDEGSYTPVQKLFGRETDLRMDDHPVVWARCVGDGRSVYAAMGHRPQAFDNPPVRQIIENSLAWVMKLNDPQEYDGC
jgi:uncharacterized protein